MRPTGKPPIEQSNAATLDASSSCRACTERPWPSPTARSAALAAFSGPTEDDDDGLSRQDDQRTAISTADPASAFDASASNASPSAISRQPGCDAKVRRLRYWNPSAARTRRSGQGGPAPSRIDHRRLVEVEHHVVQQKTAVASRDHVASPLGPHAERNDDPKTCRCRLRMDRGQPPNSRLASDVLERRDLGAPIARESASEERRIHHRVDERRTDSWVATPRPTAATSPAPVTAGNATNFTILRIAINPPAVRDGWRDGPGL